MRPRPACRHLESSQTATLDARSGWQPCLRAGGPDESASIADIEGVDPSKAAKFCMNVCISWVGLSRLTRCGHGHTLGGLWLGVFVAVINARAKRWPAALRCTCFSMPSSSQRQGPQDCVLSQPSSWHRLHFRHLRGHGLQNTVPRRTCFLLMLRTWGTSRPSGPHWYTEVQGLPVTDMMPTASSAGMRMQLQDGSTATQSDRRLGSSQHLAQPAFGSDAAAMLREGQREETRDLAGVPESGELVPNFGESLLCSGIGRQGSQGQILQAAADLLDELHHRVPCDRFM